ncbi:centromere protein C [Zea mays]|uniref:Centromere protein C n=1 Tax=Zea mays TaxID=4577 RepID=A0A1D6JN60_MAIZE|nr:centromere protein C [Zea mays]
MPQEDINPLNQAQMHGGSTKKSAPDLSPTKQKKQQAVQERKRKQQSKRGKKWLVLLLLILLYIYTLLLPPILCILGSSISILYKNYID